MPGTRVSRYALPYFAVALTALMLAELGLASGLFPFADPLAPSALVVVHLTTVGWLTLLVLGALSQFLPVISARPLFDERLSLLALILIPTGLLGMLLGFAALAFGVSAPTLPLGGALVLFGVLLAAWNLYATRSRTHPSLSSRFVAVGLAFLLATVLLGVSLALLLTGFLPLPSALGALLLSRGLPAHVAGGLGGFFTLVAMGVAYKLLAMFTLAPEERGLLGSAAFLATASGLVVLWLSLLLGGLLPWLTILTPPALALAALGIALFLADMRRLYRQRRRRPLELNTAFATAAFVALGSAIALLLVSLFIGSTSWTLAAVYLSVYGWLTGLGLTQLYKIVPFLTWLERYGPRLGKGVLPRVQDLVQERRAKPAFLAYFAAVALGTLALGFEEAALFQLAALVMLLATASIGRELLAARRVRPEVASQGPARPSAQAGTLPQR
jgi:hypothetical protein